MNLQTQLALSYYKEVGILNEEHHVTIVQHRSSRKICVKKDLSVYNLAVYQYIYHNPIPNLPRIYELLESDGVLTVIEEYVSGDTLSDYLDQHGLLSPEETADIFLKLCQIVSSLHHCNPPIIHRDIKPSNLIITESKEIYLLDINAAKYLSKDKKADTTLLGTHGYAAPEQYGFGSSDQQTDIYALGILLNQMLTGDTQLKVDRSNPFFHIIKKCTRIEASLRYQTIEDLMNDVKPIAGQPHTVYDRAWLPPGFRSGNLFHIMAAIPAYILIIFLCFTLEVKNTAPFYRIIERVLLFIFAMLLIDVNWNYHNLHNLLFFMKSKKLAIQIFGLFLVDFILFCFFTIIISFGETIFPG